MNSKRHIAQVLACLLILGTFACNKKCKKSEKISCFSPTIQAESEVGDPEEKFCPNDPDAYIPCDCYQEAGFINAFDYSQLHADVVPVCQYYNEVVPSGSCTFSGGCPSVPTSSYSVPAPYVFPVSTLPGGNAINPQFATYYYDESFGSDDLVSRPMYFEFHLNSLDEDADELQFVIKQASSGTVIASQTINKDPASYADVLRYYNSGTGEGTVKLDFSSAAQKVSPVAGSYTIQMFKNGVQQDITNFSVATSYVVSPDPPFTERSMTLTLLHAGTLDWTNYFSNAVSFQDGWDAVYGAGRSNIRPISNAPAPVVLGGDNFIDAYDDMILSDVVLSFDGTDWNIDDAINEWWNRLSQDQNWGFGYSNRIACIEIGLVYMYDITSGVPVEVMGAGGSADFQFDASLAIAFSGQVGGTYPWYDYSQVSPGGPSLTPYYSGNLVYRDMVQAMFDNNQSSFASGVDADGMSLSIMYHEMGHAWVLDANAGDLGPQNGCWYHTSYHTGKNAINICMWDYCAQLTTAQQVLFFNQWVKNPRYCELHQQVFMNQFTAQ